MFKKLSIKQKLAFVLILIPIAIILFIKEIFIIKPLKAIGVFLNWWST